MIIGIASSAMGVGKDTVADILVAQYDYVKLSFATALKREVSDCLATRTVPDDAPEICREAMRECIANGDLNPFLKPTSQSMRIVLQQWGTEYRRARYQNYWVNRVQESVDKIVQQTGSNFFVIPDVRFPNEYHWVKSRGGQMWMVQGPCRLNVGVNTAHASEGALHGLPFDAVIDNLGDMQELVGNVLFALADVPGTIPVPGIMAGGVGLEACI